ncbi:MAG: 16S rRNA (guanine(527)-N(7))-methyltransferase RsmG, partial [Pedobacter sp.]
MADVKHDIVLKYFPDLTAKQIDQFSQLFDLYVFWNAQINVISRKD